MSGAQIDEYRSRLERESSPRLRAMQSFLHAREFEPEARAAAAAILASRSEDAGRGFQRCPCCDGELEPGEVRIRGTLLGFLLVLLSYQHLWFRSDATGEEEVAVHWREARTACRCRDCGTLMVSSRR